MNKNPLEFMLGPEKDRGIGAEYRTCFLNRDVLTELTSDFTLPDYYPEIRKLLRIESRISPAGRYIGGGAAEFSGKVDYDMIYVTAEGTMASAPLGSDFSFSVPLVRSEEVSDTAPPEVIADSVAEGVNGRVLSPRKVNVKCRLRSRVRGYCRDEYLPDIDNGGECQKLTQEVICSDESRYMGEEVTLSVQIPCDTGRISPVYGRSEAYVDEIVSSGGIVTVSGKAGLKVLCMEDGQPKEFCQEIPFSCDVETDTHGEGEEHQLWTAVPFVTDTDVTLEDGSINARVTLVCCADLYRNSPLTLIEDVYFTDGEEKITNSPFKYKTAVMVGAETAELRGTIRPGNVRLTEDSRIVDVGAVAQLDGCTFENGKVVLSGHCRVTAVILSAGEYSIAEESVPFEHVKAPVCVPSGDLSCLCHAVASVTRCDLAGSVISLSGGIYLSYAVLDEKETTAVTGAEVTKTKGFEGVAVCYPADGETLWGVAKKYRIPLTSVARANDLPTSAASSPLPSSVKYMIICK